jgi:hypothetical protein
LLAPNRVTGLGGAYIALAENTEGTAVNSAAPAVRDANSFTWIDYDVMLGAGIPGAFVHTDFDNHGSVATGQPHANAGNFLELNFGGTLQVGDFGVAATGDLQRYELTTATPNTPGLTMQIGRWKALAAYGLLGGQLVVGGGARLVTMQILQQSRTLLTMTGLAPEAGVLVMPEGRQWRIGASARAPVSAGIFGSQDVTLAPDGTRSAQGFVLPRQIVMPYEVEAGFAYQLGPRPLNPGWRDPHVQEAPVRTRIESDREQRAAAYARELAALPEGKREARKRELDAEERSLRAIEDERLDAEVTSLLRVRRARYENWPREKILLLASLLWTGPSDNAVSVEGFLDQRREIVGSSISLTPRLGIEGEPVNNRLRARVGTYVEPSRYSEGTPRQHFTFGGDVKLFAFDFWGLIGDTTWKLMLFVDVAPRYTNGGIGIGNWY